MSEFPESPAGDRRPVTRRTLIAGTAAAAGALAFTGTATGEQRRSWPIDYLDVADPPAGTGPGWICLEFDNVTADAGQPVPLAIGTSRSEPVECTVSSRHGRVTLSTEQHGDGRAGTVTLRALPDRRTVVWLSPDGFGEPGEPGDQLVVRGPHGQTTVDVWIEPRGGKWEMLTRDGTEVDLGIVAVHAALMRNGDRAEVLMMSPPRQRRNDEEPIQNPEWDQQHPERADRWLWDARAMDDVETRVLDLATNETENRPMEAGGGPARKNIFCSGHAHLPDGRLLVAGGHMAEDVDNSTDVFLYDPVRKRWTGIADTGLHHARWYPTVTALPDGRMLIAAGSWKSLFDDRYWDAINNNYEIFDPERMELIATRGQALVDQDALEQAFGADARLSTYPAVFVLPGTGGAGTRIAMVESNRAWTYEYRTGQPLVRLGAIHGMQTKGSRSYPHYGSVVLLPLRPGQGRARILAVGGQTEAAGDHRLLDPEQPATTTAEMLDLYLDPSPDPMERDGWRSLPRPRRAKPRFLCDVTLLADGQVLVSGGSQRGWADQNQDPVNEAELFDPERERFRIAASANTDRRYHSAALLLPDGSVLKAGSTGGFGATKEQLRAWMRTRTDAERYLPPYLWRGRRPVITEVASGATAAGGPALRPGGQVTVTATGERLGRRVQVALIRLGSMTHGNNMDQRFVWLRVRPGGRTARAGGYTVTAELDQNPATTPPGDYMLVVLDDTGVPSTGKLVRVTTG